MDRKICCDSTKGFSDIAKKINHDRLGSRSSNFKSPFDASSGNKGQGPHVHLSWTSDGKQGVNGVKSQRHGGTE